MDGGGAKSSVGRHLEALRRNEDNGNGLWGWRTGLWSLYRVREGELRRHWGGGWVAVVGIQYRQF
jgi:hypothetical protein